MVFCIVHVCLLFSDGDSIKVFVRVRPPGTPECEFDHGTCLDVDSTNRAIIMHSKPDPKVFTFDHVADVHATQVNVLTLAPLHTFSWQPKQKKKIFLCLVSKLNFLKRIWVIVAGLVWKTRKLFVVQNECASSNQCCTSWSDSWY